MRRRYVYDGKGRAVEVCEGWRPEPRSEYHIMGDITPYQSMITGEMITSRSRHREHLRDHGCEEVGNDSSLNRKPQPLKSPPGLKEALIRAADKHLRRS